MVRRALGVTMMPELTGTTRQTFIGIDFSGATDAGRKIWLAVGHEWQSSLHIDWCFRAADLPDGGEDRDAALRVVCSFLIGQQAAIAGCDFPFALHRSQMSGADWQSWLVQNVVRQTSADTWRDALRGERELRRVTDNEMKTPMAPLNLRVYRQTFHGLRDLLYPMMQQGACVLPMMAALSESLWLVETCPASALKKAELYAPYKGAATELRAMRQRIVQTWQERYSLQMSPALEEKVIDDAGGDALDSVLAAWIAWRICHCGEDLTALPGSDYAVEGRVYA
jgi:hypothetical protein